MQLPSCWHQYFVGSGRVARGHVVSAGTRRSHDTTVLAIETTGGAVKTLPAARRESLRCFRSSRADARSRNDRSMLGEVTVGSSVVELGYELEPSRPFVFDLVPVDSGWLKSSNGHVYFSDELPAQTVLCFHPPLNEMTRQ